MLDILSEMFPYNIANRIFIYASHPLVDVVEDDSIYREIMRYPTHINSFSAWYFNEFQMDKELAVETQMERWQRSSCKEENR